MIKASELRLGNIVWESNSFTPGAEDYNEIVIASINDIDKVIRDDLGNGYSYDSLYPIPLTPEWLERCGFKRDPDTNNYDIPTYSFGGLIMRKENKIWRFIYKEKRLRTINYLHQLQNLYFALTGEELTIKK